MFFCNSAELNILAFLKNMRNICFLAATALCHIFDQTSPAAQPHKNGPHCQTISHLVAPLVVQPAVGVSSLAIDL